MRPLRLLLTLCCLIIAFFLVLSANFTPSAASEYDSPTQKKSNLRALFSFRGPSLFPASAIISLTDDNSTFFLARPAAFGPDLPSKGLSGQLWIGSGFGDDSLRNGGMTAGAEGELGCSDAPGWRDGDGKSPGGVEPDADPKRKSVAGASSSESSSSKANRLRRADTPDEDTENTRPSQQPPAEDDGTDDHLYNPSMSSKITKPGYQGSGAGIAASSEHADIQSLQESAEIAGKIVLLSRGGCGFLEKVKWAQRRGGFAVIVGDNVRGGPLVTMYARGDTSNITIPALFTSHTTAHLLSSLIPSGGTLGSLSLGDGKKNSKAVNVKDAAPGQGQGADGAGHPHTSTHSPSKSTSPPTAGKPQRASGGAPTSGGTAAKGKGGWIRYILSIFGLGSSEPLTAADTRRPPSSGHMDWVMLEDWTEDAPAKAAGKHLNPKNDKEPKSTTKAGDNFVIGVQDWRDPDLLPQKTQTSKSTSTNPTSKGKPAESGVLKGGSVLPGSGEYEKVNTDSKRKPEASSEKLPAKGDGKSSGVEQSGGWLGHLFGGDEHEKSKHTPTSPAGGRSNPTSKPGSHSNGNGGGSGSDPNHHEGLWVTLTPTSMSSSPFFDTLLVLVVSPLITLTVVYALLLLRARIRRRRWRAPKSVVDRLPVRTYHTLSSDSSTTSTPMAGSPTTPLLQPSSRSNLPRSRPRSRTTSEVPAPTSSSFRDHDRSSPPPQEKHESGLAEWRRRYGGRQKECVVCLEEYVDGISRVMSLPCGHEFHAECITPWLTTRRRTCPICKGDVVRSLGRGNPASSSRRRQPQPQHHHHNPFFDDPSDPDDIDDVQSQAAESQSASPAAAIPVPSEEDDLYEQPDLERGDEDPDERERTIGLRSPSSFWRSLTTYLSGVGRRGYAPIDRDR